MKQRTDFHVCWPWQQCYALTHRHSRPWESTDSLSAKQNKENLEKNKTKHHPGMLAKVLLATQFYWPLSFFSWLSCSFSQLLCLSNYLVFMQYSLAVTLPGCFFQVWLACHWPKYIYVFLNLKTINWLHKLSQHQNGKENENVGNSKPLSTKQMQVHHTIHGTIRL